MTDDMPITMKWRAGVSLPEIPPEAEVAERLVLLAHYGADFSIWGGTRRARYWDALLERVKAATYAGPTLGDWWQAMSKSLPCAARNTEERADLVQLLGHEPAIPVLNYLRRHPDYLVLRVRVIAEARRNEYEMRKSGEAEDSND